MTLPMLLQPLAIYGTFIVARIMNTYKWNKLLLILDEDIIKSGQKTAINWYIHVEQTNIKWVTDN